MNGSYAVTSAPMWTVREKSGMRREMGVRETDISRVPLTELTQRPRDTELTLSFLWLGFHPFNKSPCLANFNPVGVGTGCGGTNDPSSCP